MKPSFFNRFDRRIFTGESAPTLLERVCDVVLAVSIALSLAAILWG
jgi:hypothetical protein